MEAPAPVDLVAEVKSHSRRAIGRLITAIEEDTPGVYAAMAMLFPQTGQAHIVGITGPTGTGKSTLIGRLARIGLDAGRKVAIVAVDPSSPFSGGALLGDRIRMPGVSGPDEAFIRSVGSRGFVGGLSRSVRDIVKVLDAAGFDLILVETVGAGQSEVEIMRMSHTTVVTVMPGLGDDLQVNKAGILEIADIFVCNKMDLQDSDIMVRDLQALVRDGAPRRGWTQPVLGTQAKDNQGMDELYASVIAHAEQLRSGGHWETLEREHFRQELASLLQEQVLRRFREGRDEERLMTLVDRIVARELDPHSAAQMLLEDQDTNQMDKVKG